MKIEFVARETQDFASLQGWRHCDVMMRICVLYRCRLKVETQNLASHSYVSPIFIGGNMLMEIESVARETQDFASLQAGTVVIVREKGWRVVADGDLG